MKKISLLILLLGASSVFSQRTKYTLPEHGIFKEKQTEKTPAQYPGGIPAFMLDVSKEIKTRRIKGSEKAQASAQFNVNPTGELENVIVMGNNEDFNKEIERVLKSMKKKWIPGQQNGKPVSVPYRVPFVMNFD